MQNFINNTAGIFMFRFKIPTAPISWVCLLISMIFVGPFLLEVISRNFSLSMLIICEAFFGAFFLHYKGAARKSAGVMLVFTFITIVFSFFNVLSITQENIAKLIIFLGVMFTSAISITDHD